MTTGSCPARYDGDGGWKIIRSDMNQANAAKAT
jgi:hypothetical protein